VADKIVMGERHGGQRHEVRRDNESEDLAQPGPGNCHASVYGGWTAVHLLPGRGKTMSDVRERSRLGPHGHVTSPRTRLKVQRQDRARAVGSLTMNG